MNESMNGMTKGIIGIMLIFSGVPFCVLGAPVVKAQGYGTLETEPFPATFEPVRATDLANADQKSFLELSDVDTGGRPDSAMRLFDGEVGTRVGSEAQFNKGSVTVNFDLSEHKEGYVITGVNTYAGWNIEHGGRADQEYTLTMIFVDGSEKQIVSGTHYENRADAEGENGQVNVWTEVRISDDSGSLARRVKAVRFDFHSGANGGGPATYTEFDIIGYPFKAPLLLGGQIPSLKVSQI